MILLIRPEMSVIQYFYLDVLSHRTSTHCWLNPNLFGSALRHVDLMKFHSSPYYLSQLQPIPLPKGLPGLGYSPLLICLFTIVTFNIPSNSSELFPDYLEVMLFTFVLLHREGYQIYENRYLLGAVGLNTIFLLLPHWGNLSKVHMIPLTPGKRVMFHGSHFIILSVQSKQQSIAFFSSL